MVENGFTEPSGTVCDFILFQIEMNQTVFFIAEQKHGLFCTWLDLALRFVLFRSHQITIEISACAFPLPVQKNKIFSIKRGIYRVKLYFYKV